jgi:hypothetical protein
MIRARRIAAHEQTCQHCQLGSHRVVSSAVVANVPMIRHMPRKDRTEAQEVEIMRRWIYRSFARELQKWFMAYAPQRIPQNQTSYAQILAICHNVLVSRWTDPAWTIEVREPDAIAKAQRRGPTVILKYKGEPV